MNQYVERNQYMLKGPLKRRGYDWWWHNFTAYNSETNEAKAFFIEYYICNPALVEKEPVLGQLPEHKKRHKKPSYVMIKCGVWGESAKQIHNFYSIDELKIKKGCLDLSIGNCYLSETAMKGSCSLSNEDAKSHPEFMSDAGEMSWNLKINKRISYSVGYGASLPFRLLNAFEMFWHVQGMKTEYEGEIILDGVKYNVIADRSYGYADKNWGGDFTSPWLWISSCHLKSNLTGSVLKNSAFDFGGGRPKVFGIALSRRLLGCFVYEGKKYEFNFSKFWTGARIEFSFTEGEKVHKWKCKAISKDAILYLQMVCPKEEMLLINYESPDGTKRHNRLWNGGTGRGRMKLYEINGKNKRLIDDISFYNTGCEYGEYDQ